MKTEGFNQLLVDWKSAIETGDQKKCTKTSSALCQYFYATSKVLGQNNDMVNAKARDVFMLLQSPPETPFARQITRLSAETIVDPTITGSFSLIKLQELLESYFSQSCRPQALSAHEEQQKQAILIEALQSVFDSKEVVADDPIGWFAESVCLRKEFIMELEAELFIPPDYLVDELSFEHLPFISKGSVLEGSLSLTKTKEFIMQVLEGRRSVIYDDANVYLAISRLFLNRFYEAYPEMIAPREVDLRAVAYDDLPQEYRHQSLMIEMDYAKSLKIISLWLTFKATEETAPNIDHFINTLVQFNCLNREALGEAGYPQLKTWINGMEVAFLKAINYDVSFESFDQAGRNQLAEVTQAIAEISIEAQEELRS